MKFVCLFVASALTALAVVVSVHAQYVSAPDIRQSLGNRVPDGRFVDERGDTLRLSDFAGTPLVLSPVFTKCPHACPAITAGLMEALDGLGGVGETFKILTLSFDPDDTPADLRAYREKTGMPQTWSLAVGTTDQVDPVLEAVDFRYAKLDVGGFAHANAVVFLTSELGVSGYVHGLMYTKEEVKAELRAAAGHDSFVGRARPYLLPIAAAFLVVTVLVILLTTRRSPAPAVGGNEKAGRKGRRL